MLIHRAMICSLRHVFTLTCTHKQSVYYLLH
uniref:Uncharacterized protein n=1 Tax=Anguilla anguilla TaxID=7936 RepID=A0A0E9U396_ANGAN